MNKQNIFFDRNRFEALSNWASRRGITAQLSKIRLSTELVDGKGLYDFDIAGKNGVPEGDIVLDRNDLFVPSSIGLFLSIDTLKPSTKAPLLTYPIGANKQMRYFKNVGDLEAIYNGELEIGMNQVNINRSFPCELFRIVPETQPVNMLKSDNTEVSAGLIPEFDLQKSLFPLAPEYYFQGKVNTEIKLLFNGRESKFTVCEPSNGADSTTHKARLVLYMLGTLVVNGSDVADDVAELIRK